MSWRETTLINLDEDIIEFWEGLKRHEFLLFRCRRCWSHYWPATYCNRHADIPRFDEMEWVPTTGRGVVFTWTIVHQVVDHRWQELVPYPLAMVELEEGPMFATRIVGCEPTDVEVGMQVEIAYEDVPETEITWPLFRPRAGK